MLSVFDTIKSIQKIDRKILSHTEKNLLISIAVHLGKNNCVWPSNSKIGEWIGESKDYAKVLLSNLKKKGFLNVRGRQSKRRCSLNIEKIKGNVFIDYDTFLDSDYWKKIRSRVIKKFKYACALCNSKKNIHVHHRTYENLGKENLNLEDLIVLCSECHAKFHNKLEGGL